MGKRVLEMGFIKTGLEISKTIRNASRLQEIVLVFAKHGFAEFISSGVISSIPSFVLPKSKTSIKSELERKGRLDRGQILGSRLRLCFEELGPAFIKFGQLLASREDLFDSSFVDEMKLLRDRVRPVPFSKVRASVEKSLGKKIQDVFLDVEENPIGTASIGVVYKGKLKNGDEIVLKVQRPGIEKAIKTDFYLLKFIAGQAEKNSEEAKFLGICRIVNDFTFALVNELNFNIEALNAKRFSKVLKKHDSENYFYIPKIYSDLSRENLLIMEYLEGIPFSNIQALGPYKDNLEIKLGQGLKTFIRTFLLEGHFHADLHGGNFFLLTNEKIGIIDFGLMGSLSRRGRKSFIAIVYALLTFNYENLVFEFLDIAEYERIPDIDSLTVDVREALSPFIGLTAQQSNFSVIIKSIVKTLKKHQIFLPREWFSFFRGLATLDGVGRSIGMDFDLYTTIEEDIHEIVKDSFNKDELIEEGIWAMKDLASFGRSVPRHLKWFLKEWSKKGYAHELILQGHQRPLGQINSSLIFLGFCLLASVFIICGATFISPLKIETFRDIPTIVWFFWALGTIFFIKGMFSLKKN